MAGAFRDSDSTCPIHGAVVVVKSDSTVIPTTRGLYIGTTGDVAVTMADDNAVVTFKAVPVGILPIQVTKVMSTNTAASTCLLYTKE
jgi:hypothetical protein